MERKVQPILTQSLDLTEVSESEILNLENAADTLEVSDPFFDDGDIELFNETLHVDSELKDEKRVARLTRTLFDRSNVGHDVIDHAKVKQENKG